MNKLIIKVNGQERMIKLGELPAVKVGKVWRIRKIDLDQFTTPM